MLQFSHCENKNFIFLLEQFVFLPRMDIAMLISGFLKYILLFLLVCLGVLYADPIDRNLSGQNMSGWKARSSPSSGNSKRVIDSILISILIVCAFYLVEHLWNYFNPKNNLSDQCGACENFTLVSSTPVSNASLGKEIILQKDLSKDAGLLQTTNADGSVVQVLDNVQYSDTVLQDYINKTANEPQKVVIKNGNKNSIYVRVDDNGTGTNIDFFNPPSFQVKALNTPNIQRGTLRDGTDIIENEMVYTDFNLIPDKNLSADQRYFDPSYTFMPPSQWYPTPPRPPVCVSSSRCDVCPITSNVMDNNFAEYANLADFGTSRRIMPPDNINTQYIHDKLNTGR